MGGLAIAGGGVWVQDRKSELLFMAHMILARMTNDGLLLLARLLGIMWVICGLPEVEAIGCYPPMHDNDDSW